ncbi:unnamed protein product (macronuclear) [Paramecium tetraurelia]|uniref:PAS domain-containing protein n=1 Tax=Paramecium tetraurelia TaxID=5888 RepID=A0CGJ2_PARTE|nr:uncharacterized protein GSPATT00007349001 [Paramecium tetraurelia]CAK69909.1 unnamed protein product [Paramecium tetraurelia]|eukprot:XP_001437306.1 hypothetical protein (macronuclear) [Paramecium tetraurelia strain d4-2]
MISLPFHKWKLNFYDPDFEAEFEAHQNKIRLISFQMLNLLVSIAALICLITFVIQQQPIQLILIMIGVVGGCFFMLLIGKKLEPYLRQIFSFYFVWSQSTNILVALSGLDIPLFIFGFNTCCFAIGTMQYSDNRLKIVYTIVTPFVLLGVFDNYKAGQMHFIFQTIACVVCIGIWTYMQEYTARLAFSLNLIANKQKEIVNQFVNDAMFAISVDPRTRQIILEFQNKKFEESMNIKETEQMKNFLRSSYIVIKSQESQKKLVEKGGQKGIKLEEFLFKKIKSVFQPIQQDVENEVQIMYHNLITDQMMGMKIQIMQMNFGKPILIGIIKSEQVENLIGEHQKQIKEHQQLILNFSSQIVQQQENLYKEIKKTKQVNFQEYEQTMSLKCLNLSIINYIRNYIFYFQRNKISTQLQTYERFQIYEYLNTIQKYFRTLACYYKLSFNIYNQVDKNCQININTKYLTQILINVFELIAKQSLYINNVTLKILEEFTQYDQVLETRRRVEDSQNGSKQIIAFKLIQFQFNVDSSQQLSLSYINNLQIKKEIECDENYIIQEVTTCLLDCLGPINTIQIDESEKLESGNYRNRFSFKIYSDQSQLEPSYLKAIDKPIVI